METLRFTKSQFGKKNCSFLIINECILNPKNILMELNIMCISSNSITAIYYRMQYVGIV